MLAAFEFEHRREQLRPEPLLVQPLRDRVHTRHLILQVGIPHDDPRVAERILAALELRA
jgi:hypothetical protein